jgi:hypothetical protein
VNAASFSERLARIGPCPSHEWERGKEGGRQGRVGEGGTVATASRGRLGSGTPEMEEFEDKEVESV